MFGKGFSPPVYLNLLRSTRSEAPAFHTSPLGGARLPDEQLGGARLPYEPPVRPVACRHEQKTERPRNEAIVVVCVYVAAIRPLCSEQLLGTTCARLGNGLPADVVHRIHEQAFRVLCCNLSTVRLYKCEVCLLPFLFCWYPEMDAFFADIQQRCEKKRTRSNRGAEALLAGRISSCLSGSA